TMGLRSFAPMVVACPGWGRTTSTTFQTLADKIQSWLREQMPLWSTRYPGMEARTVAVMGGGINGPGEGEHATIWISSPRSGESPGAPVYVDGVKTVTLKGEGIAEQFQDIVAEYVRRRYGEAQRQSLAQRAPPAQHSSPHTTA